MSKTAQLIQNIQESYALAMRSAGINEAVIEEIETTVAGAIDNNVEEDDCREEHLTASLRSALPALIRLGDFVGNVDEGGPSNQGRIDRCALILSIRQLLGEI